MDDGLMVDHGPSSTLMISLNRAVTVWNENESVPEGWREKISMPSRSRLAFSLSGLVEGVLGKLSEKISIKNRCIFANHVGA